MFGKLKLTSKEKIFLFSSFFYIIYVIFPLFADVTHIPVYVPAFVVIIGVMFSYSRYLKFPANGWLTAYICLLLVYAMLGLPIHINGTNDSLPAIWRVTIEAAWILPSLLIASVLCNLKDQRMYRIFGYGSIALLTISFLYILPLVISSANILREDIQNVDIIRPIGLPDYSLMHSYALMLVPLCLMVKVNKGSRRLIALGLTILFFYLVTQTSVTTSLFVSIFIFIFAYIYKEDSSRKTFIGLAMTAFVLYALYTQGFFLWLVDSLMPFFDGTAVSYKLQDFHDSLSRGSLTGNTIEGRMNYHDMSIDSFLRNPIVGGGIAGGHSKILDVLGRMGLVVFLPFAMMIWKTLKVQQTLAGNRLIRGFLTFSYVCAFVYLYEKGLFGASGWLFMLVIVPCAIFAQRKGA